ncbi:MAG: pyridoxamine 5'-phosphate oxidase family protein [Anaerolineae bacterium]
MSALTDSLPPRLLAFLSGGAPAILASTGADGWPHLVMTWVVARDAWTVRVAVDVGSTTQANLERSGAATVQILGPDNLIFLVKGRARTVKPQLDAAPFPICMLELMVFEVKDQAWPVAAISPLRFEWQEEGRPALEDMERRILAEMREWEE